MPCTEKLSRSSRIQLAANRNGFRPFNRHCHINHCLYRGNWKDDQHSGFGLLFNDKTQIHYEGSFIQGVPHGFGVTGRMMPHTGFKLIYAGNWIQGSKEGIGSYHFPDGSVYDGQFANNKSEGKGKRWYCDGSYYEGDWKDGKREGIGFSVDKRGNRYEGKWYNGWKHGPGVFYMFVAGRCQEGTWLKDICVTSTMRDIQYKKPEYRIPSFHMINWHEKFETWTEDAMRKVLNEKLKKEFGEMDVTEKESEIYCL